MDAAGAVDRQVSPTTTRPILSAAVAADADADRPASPTATLALTPMRLAMVVAAADRQESPITILDQTPIRQATVAVVGATDGA